MADLDKKSLSERDICTKFITPAVKQAGWDEMSQIREEVSFTKGRIIVRGKLVTRGKAKRADYILYYKPNLPIALIEAKDNSYPVGGGMQQGLEYAETLDIPFVFSSNGDGFVFHDRTGRGTQREVELALDGFPTPETLWQKYRVWKAKRKKRILYLADRNVLIDQTMVNDFRPFGKTMAKLSTSSKTIEREDGNVVDLPLAVDKKHQIGRAHV